MGYAVDCCYRFCLTASGEEIFGGLVEVKKEESADEHYGCHDAKCQGEIPPSFIFCGVTAWDVGRGDVAGQ